MKLRKQCRHGWYDEHMYYGPTDTKTERCPGGVFLPDDSLQDAAWQFNEAVSLLREVRGSVMLPVLVHEIDDSLFAMQAALEGLVEITDALSVREAEPDPDQLEVPFKNDRGAW